MFCLKLVTCNVFKLWLNASCNAASNDWLSDYLTLELSCSSHRGLYPFGQYISYTNQSFTLEEIKHLWRKHRCATKYNRDLSMRVDNFEHPSETNVLCSDWNSWKDPIIQWVLQSQPTNSHAFTFPFLLAFSGCIFMYFPIWTCSKQTFIVYLKYDFFLWI